MAGRPTTRKPTPFGAKLIALREDRGLTQTELARLSGVPQQRIAYYERRAQNPSVDVVAKLAAALGMRVDEIVGAIAPSSSARKKPGRRSQLDERVERIRRLSRRDQAQVIEVIDALLMKHGV